MTRSDQLSFRDVLRRKQAEVSARSRRLDSIAIERSADMLEEVQYKAERDLAISSLNRNTVIRRNVEMALIRINDGSFGTCVHCDEDIGKRRLEAVPWTSFCIACQEAADRGDESILESIEPTFLDAA
jgi:DnaK suppressor protein